MDGRKDGEGEDESALQIVWPLRSAFGTVAVLVRFEPERPGWHLRELQV